MPHALNADDVAALYSVLLERAASDAEISTQLAATDDWRAVFAMIAASDERALVTSRTRPSQAPRTTSVGALVVSDHRLERRSESLVSSVSVRGAEIPDGFRLELRWHAGHDHELDASLTPFLPVDARKQTRACSGG